MSTPAKAKHLPGAFTIALPRKSREPHRCPNPPSHNRAPRLRHASRENQQRQRQHALGEGNALSSISRRSSDSASDARAGAVLVLIIIDTAVDDDGRAVAIEQRGGSAAAHACGSLPGSSGSRSGDSPACLCCHALLERDAVGHELGLCRALL